VAGGSTSSEEITVSHPPTYGDRLSTAVIVEERRNGLRTMRLPDLTDLIYAGSSLSNDSEVLDDGNFWRFGWLLLRKL